MADKVWVIASDDADGPSSGAGRPTPVPKASRKSTSKTGAGGSPERGEGSDDSMIVVLLAFRPQGLIGIQKRREV